MNESPHTRELFWKNRLHESLSCILIDWMPKKVVGGWTSDLHPVYKTQVCSIFFALIDVFSHKGQVRDLQTCLQLWKSVQQGKLVNRLDIIF
jgi:hypothetical protein